MLVIDAAGEWKAEPNALQELINCHFQISEASWVTFPLLDVRRAYASHQLPSVEQIADLIDQQFDLIDMEAKTPILLVFDQENIPSSVSRLIIEHTCAHSGKMPQVVYVKQTGRHGGGWVVDPNMTETRKDFSQ